MSSLRCPSPKLLLVEDDLLLARGLMRALSLSGIAVRHVARCAAAYALKGPFVAGVFDIDLVDGDGVEVAFTLRARGVVGQLVFHTACTDPARLERARSLGPVFVKSTPLAPLVDQLQRAPSAVALAH